MVTYGYIRTHECVWSPGVPPQVPGFGSVRVLSAFGHSMSLWGCFDTFDVRLLLSIVCGINFKWYQCESGRDA